MKNIQNPKKVTIGILAHVDAGKTTLSEGILYKTGVIKKPGRVDHGQSFLDSDMQEKNRGITIFASQAEFTLQTDGDLSTNVILLDTPGHVDFSAEMERTLSVLDYAILVISGKDGVQGHTATLWKLLKGYNIPTFIFVNKMDLAGTDPQNLLSDIKTRLNTACFDLSKTISNLYSNNETIDTNSPNNNQDLEELAMCDDTLLDEFIQSGSFTRLSLAKAIKSRHIFPCFFGSALKLEGVDELLRGLNFLTLGYEAETEDPIDKGSSDGEALSVRVFRITHGKQGERLTHLKILRGKLRVRDTLLPQNVVNNVAKASEGEQINQIRIYSGDKFRTVNEAMPGSICAVTGLKSFMASNESQLESVMTYNIVLPDETNIHDAYSKLKHLEEEDPMLHITWDKHLEELQIKLMGKVQMEVLQEIIRNRFDLELNFSDGKIAYKETILKPIIGVGHYEPLRHYAEVHLLLEPLPRGSGIQVESMASEDELDRNWQRLITTHIIEKEHSGTLTRSPITDMKITIISGRAHEKHTEGGDFRQATYRAIRQGLRKSLNRQEMVLLEPWYEFELEVPQEMIGRAMADIQRMGGRFEAPSSSGSHGEIALLRGRAPVSEMKDYVTAVASFTKGYGHLSCNLDGYAPCHNQEEVCTEIDYKVDGDIDNSADSIFCSQGAGHNVSWDKVHELLHIPLEKLEDYGYEKEGKSPGENLGNSNQTQAKGPSGQAFDNNKELQRIFDRTFNTGGKNAGYGKRATIEARQFDSELERRKKEAERKRRAKEEAKKREKNNLPEILLVDGYNIVFAWDELKDLAKVNIDSAREALIDILNNYQGYKKCDVVVVFDAYKIKGGKRSIQKQGNITVVYTAEAETADTYIEKATYDMANGKKEYRVRVATSDRLEQIIIMGNDAIRLSAKDFKLEVEQVDREITEVLKNLNRKNEIQGKNRIQIQ